MKLTYIVIVSAIFLILNTAGIVNGSLYSIPPTEEQKKIGTDENGKRLDYNECPGYDDGVDPSEYRYMSYKRLGEITENVDKRVIELRAQGDSLSEDEQEELECLEAIRTIEVYGEMNFIQKTKDLIKGIEALQTLNELNEKYN